MAGRRQAGWIVVALAVLAPAAVRVSGQAPSEGSAPDTDPRERNLTAYVELLRADIRVQKVAVITEVMQFTDEEDQKFWPIYREYDVELSRLNDERVQLIRKYAEAYGNITDPIADQIASAALDLESRRTALKQKYYDRLKTATSPRTAARFLQVENQLLLLIDLQIAASLPLAQ